MNVNKDPTLDLAQSLADSPGYTERCNVLHQILALSPEERDRLRQHLLKSFTSWAIDEAEERSCPRLTVRCVAFLRDLLEGAATIDPKEALMERSEPFSRVSDTLNLALYLGLETDSDAMDGTLSDCFEAALRCPQCNGLLTDFMALVLVIRLLHDFRIQRTAVPVPLERQLRLYFILSLSTAPADLALTWAMGDNP